MPNRLFWTPLTHGQTFGRLQLPFLVGVGAISAASMVAVPEVDGSISLWTGLIITVLASALFLLPRREWMLTGAVIVVPILDIVAIAFVRAALLTYLPAIGMMCLIPFAWIAYRFRWPGLVIVLAGGIFIASLPFILGGRPMTTPLAVLNVLTLPVIATGISVGIHLGAVSFRQGRESVEDASRKLRGALARSKDAEVLIRTVLDTVNGAVAYYDAKGAFVLANSASEQLVDVVEFRFDVSPFAGPNVYMADRTTVIPSDEQIIPRALRGDVVSSQLEWWGPTGNQVAILVSSRRVLREDGVLLGTVVAAYDVTELADAIEVREHFLATVSHELRTPLTSIIGYTDETIDVLGAEASRLGVAAFLDTIARNADVLLDRVSELLTAADKTMELNVETVSLGDVLERALQPFTLLAERAGLTVSIDVSRDLVVDVDAARITQAVENLVANAVKFTGRGGGVSITAFRETTGDVCVTVADTGIGMSQEEQRRIFDRFFRAKVARDNAVQGIGIGMSVVRAIVEAHRGHIAIDSAPGEGSRISIRLPASSPVLSSIGGR